MNGGGGMAKHRESMADCSRVTITSVVQLIVFDYKGFLVKYCIRLSIKYIISLPLVPCHAHRIDYSHKIYSKKIN